METFGWGLCFFGGEILFCARKHGKYTISETVGPLCPRGYALFVYTGVPETADSKGGEYTQEYLQEYLNRVVKHQYQLMEITDAIGLDLQRFSGGIQQKRDSTIMIFRYFGA